MKLLVIAAVLDLVAAFLVLSGGIMAAVVAKMCGSDPFGQGVVFALAAVAFLFLLDKRDQR
jgi:membrane protein implicated in regulation of membrane protease activity